MQVWTKGFFLMLGCSLGLALFMIQIILAHKDIQIKRRRLYMFSFSIVWTLFQIAVFQ